MGHELIDLTKNECVGRGKLADFGARRSSGTETGSYQVDVGILRRVETIDEARALESMFPGIAREYQASFGEDSTGKRKREFVPVDPNVRLLLVHAEKGKQIFQGMAEARLARFNVSAKASTLLVKLRLLHADAVVGHKIMDWLNDEISVELEQSNGVLPFPTVDEDGGNTFGETGADEGAIVPEVGNLIVVRSEEPEGEPEFGVVRAIDGEDDDAVIAYSDIGVNEHSHATLDRVENVIAVCTEKGATSDRSLRRLWAKYRTEAEPRGKEATARNLTVAIAEASGRGLIEQGEDGWPITDAVIALAVGVEPAASEVS